MHMLDRKASDETMFVSCIVQCFIHNLIFLCPICLFLHFFFFTSFFSIRPPQAFPGASYPNPTMNPTFAPIAGQQANLSPTWAPTVARNVDLGGNALRETANVSFGIASVIGAAILLMRAITNTVINHPRTHKSSAAIAYFETSILALGWSFTLCGMVACGLGYEPKTGWAVFSMAIFAIIGYAVCYAYQVQEDNEKALALQDGAADPSGIQHLPPCC